MDFDALVALAAREGCSDLHLTSGEPPVFRRDGALYRPAGLDPVDAAAISVLTPPEFPPEQDADFACEAAGRRLRVNLYRQAGRPTAAVRLLAGEIPSLDELCLPAAVAQLCDEPNGLILVTGPTGSGKSTTLAAMIDHIAHSRPAHIITIEDPVEYVYTDSGRALIHQRELGRDVPSFAQALRSALREDPDIILVGEMRDLETISAAVTAAETGHLVLSTLHTTGAARTVERIVDSFPSEARAMLRTQLSGILRGVVSQQLVPVRGGGRTAATEVMLGTDAVRNLIREGKSQQLPSVMQSGAAQGMHTMEASLARLVRTGQLDRPTAARLTPNPTELNQLLG